MVKSWHKNINLTFKNIHKFSTINNTLKHITYSAVKIHRRLLQSFKSLKDVNKFECMRYSLFMLQLYTSERCLVFPEVQPSACSTSIMIMIILLHFISLVLLQFPTVRCVFPRGFLLLLFLPVCNSWEPHLRRDNSL